MPNAATDAVVAPAANQPTTLGSTLPACRNLTVQAGASLTVAVSAILDVWGNADSAGVISGTVRMRAGGTLATTGTGVLGSVTLLSGSYVISNARFDSLWQDSGAGLLTIQDARVFGDIVLRGAGALGLAGSTLDVDGLITVNSAVPITTPPTTIRARGAWISDASWQPTSGTVIFASTGTTNAAIAPNTRFFNFEVDSGQGHVLVGDLLVDGALRLRGNMLVTGTTIDLGQRAGISLNVSLTGPAVTSLRIRNGLTAAGRIVLPAAVLDADGDMTFFVSGYLELGNGVHHISNSLGHAGIIVAPPAATFEFDGSGNLTTSVFTVLPNVRLTGSNFTIFDMQVGGNFVLAAGAGSLSIARCVVGGDVTLAGASVVGISSGLFDVDGDFTWQTTGIVNTPPAAISVAGDFTATGTFQPTSGSVVLDGNGIQLVTRPAFAWHNLRIGPGSQVSTALAVQATGVLDVRGQLTSTGLDIESQGALQVPGSLIASACTRVRAHAGLTVAGQLLAVTARLDVDGDLVVAGVLQLGVGGHEASGSVVVTGSVSMPAGQELILDGSGVIDAVVSSPIPNVWFTGTDYEVLALRVSENLLQAAGAMAVTLCIVDGDATFQGLELNDNGGGLLDVGGSVTVATVAPVSVPPAVWRCAGDWTADASFAPLAGLVELDGPGAQVVTMPVFQWFNLRIQPSSFVNTAQDATTLGFLDVRGQLVVGGASLQVDGGFTVGSTGVLQAANASTLILSGNSSVQGTMSAPVGALNTGSDFTVASTGAVLLGAGPHELQGSLTIQGSWTTPAGAQTSFLGAGFVDVTPATVLPSVVFGGAGYTVTRLTVQNQVSHINGLLRVSSLHCLGNASFQGATVETSGLGSLDVAGNLEFATTNIVVSPPASIRCGGTWTSNSQFLPVSGSIEMVGGAPQVMNGPQLQLVSLRVGPGSSVSFSPDDVVLQRDLTVDGQLIAPGGTLEIRRNLATGGGGSLLLDQLGTCTVAGNVANLGAIVGPGVLSMVGVGAVSGAGSFPTLRLASPGEISVSGAVGLGGDLLQESGTLRFIAGASMHVAGSWLGAAGTLRGAAGTTLDVDGAVLLEAVAAHATGVPDILAGDDWQAGSAFVPAAGTVFLDGTGELRSSGGTLSFARLEVTTGGYSAGSDLVVDADDVIVAGAASLDIGGRRVDLSANTVVVDGVLSIGAGGVLYLGALTDVDVTAAGSLAVVGEWNRPASVDGPAGGGYSFVVNGAVQAMNYSFAHMGPAGIRITAGATIAPSPRDLRGGRFADGDAAPGSCLLHIDRAAPQQLRYVRFEDPGVVTHNVRSTGTAAVQIVNDSGSLSGPAFEDDIGAVIDWLPAEHSVLASFSARAAVHRTELRFETTAEVDVSRFRLTRSQQSTGPFVEVAGSPVAPTGGPALGGSYAATDTFVLDTVRYHYRLEEVLLHGEPRTLGDDFARPWPQQVGNSWFVGTNGGYADIAAAVAAAAPGGNVVVQGGTYPAFTINKGVRIVPDGSGPVIIDTTTSKLVVRDIPAGAFEVSLHDLLIGGATSPFGMEIVNCDNNVVLDGLQVSTGLGVVGLLVDDVTHIAVQNCAFSGDPGLRFTNGSSGYLSRGSIDELEVLGGSAIKVCHVTPGSTNVGIGSNATQLPAAMPSLSVSGVWPGDKPTPLVVTATPGSFFAVVYSLRRDYIDLTPVFPIDMVLLVEQAQAVSALSGLMGPAGQQQIQIRGPGGANGWGFSVPLQVLELRPDLTGRMGTSRDVVFVP